MDNSMRVLFDARSENEALARMIVAAFLTPMNPTMDELDDVKTAVSEAVTNSIIHGYLSEENRQVELICRRNGQILEVEVADEGVGISDITLAREPFYTTRPKEERSGMGFSFMEAFMNTVEVESTLQKGTRVIMTKIIGGCLV